MCFRSDGRLTVDGRAPRRWTPKCKSFDQLLEFRGHQSAPTIVTRLTRQAKLGRSHDTRAASAARCATGAGVRVRALPGPVSSGLHWNRFLDSPAPRRHAAPRRRTFQACPPGYPSCGRGSHCVRLAGLGCAGGEQHQVQRGGGLPGISCFCQRERIGPSGGPARRTSCSSGSVRSLGTRVTPHSVRSPTVMCNSPIHDHPADARRIGANVGTGSLAKKSTTIALHRAGFSTSKPCEVPGITASSASGSAR
jgi:hypothetical protein